jgi:hypothetical protein
MAAARTRVDALEVTPGEVSAWFPMRIIEVIARTSGGLPAPSAPRFERDAVLWSVALPPVEHTLGASEREAVCTEMQRIEPRIACETDAATLQGTERARWVFAWRSPDPLPRANLATPLRALSRVGDRACLRSFERTLHTVELGITTRDLRGLGETLALLAAAPRLADLVLVRAENRPGDVRAELSWSTDRADRAVIDMQDDSWPTRCGGRSELLAGDATALRALFAARGTRAQGAVIERASRQWIVTVGDRVGDAEVLAVGERALRVERSVRGRPRAFELPWSGSGADEAGANRPVLALPPEPVQRLPVPLPR